MAAKTLLGTLLLVLLCVTSTFAWGSVGHATVASIAQQLLTPRAWQAVQVINGNGVSLASVSSQPDAYGHTANGRWSSPLHYVNMAPGSTHFVMGQDCSDSVCVVGAIMNFTAQARSTVPAPWPYIDSSSLPSYITFLVHFVGDIHQPLHVGWASDRGGNNVKCTFFGKKSELHAVWDTLMIEHSGMGVDAFTADLMNFIKTNPNLVNSWKSQVSVSAWANESFQYVLNNVYDFGKDRISMNLGQAYYSANWPIVRLRVAAAGVRLATLLNNIYS